MSKLGLPPITRKMLGSDLRKLGVAAGDTIMLHASVKAVGWVVGGPDMIIQALLDTVGREGTLMMYISWEDSPYQLAQWPENWQKAYFKECPPFDPATSRAYRKWSILTEYLRTWLGAFRSSHPDASFAAVGTRAQWITEGHSLQYGYGPASPLARLCEAQGKVLLLGAPFDSITLLHYAEHMANVPNKQIVHYRMPVLKNGQRIWVNVEEFDTCGNVLPDAEKYFELITSEYLTIGKGKSGKVGQAPSYLFDAADFVEFAIQWIEKRYRTKQ